MKLLYAPCMNALSYLNQVLEAENRSGKGTEGVGPHYKVHYKGWKRTYITAPGT